MGVVAIDRLFSTIFCPYYYFFRQLLVIILGAKEFNKFTEAKKFYTCARCVPLLNNKRGLIYL